MLGIRTGLLSAAIVTRSLVFDDAEHLEPGVDDNEVSALLVDACVRGAILAFEKFAVGDLAEHASCWAKHLWDHDIQIENQLLLGLIQEGPACEVPKAFLGLFSTRYGLCENQQTDEADNDGD